MGASAQVESRAWHIAHAGLDLDAAFLAFDQLLRSRVEYAIASWSTHDPATGLFTSCTMSGVPKDPEGEARLFRCEFTAGEPSSYRSLIGDHGPPAILSRVTDGNLDRASRFREIFAPVGLTDELRAVLWADGIAWGSATLLRAGGRFEPRDVEALRSITRHAGHGIRLALLRAAANRPEAVEEPPGVVEVEPDGRVEAVTSPAERWLESAGVGLVTAVNATAAAVRGAPARGPSSSRLLLSDGRVVAIHAATSADSDRVAVIIDRARPAQVSAMLVDAYGLTPRQRDVLGRILLGRSMTEIARGLGISEHTAHDHRKAIYRCMGVSSRSELAALLQFEQYDPRVWSDIPPSPYGGFLDDGASRGNRAEPGRSGAWAASRSSKSSVSAASRRRSVESPTDRQRACYGPYL